MKNKKHSPTPKVVEATPEEVVQASTEKDPQKVSSLSEYRDFLSKQKGASFKVDEHNKTGTTIDHGWTAIYGMWAIVLGGSSIALAKNLGFDPLSLQSQPLYLIVVKIFAGVAALANFYSWNTNPKADLHTLTIWLATPNNKYFANNNERWLILFQMLLVTSICVSSLISPVIFGLIGMFTYITNCLGFTLIIKKIRHALGESRQICDRFAPRDSKTFLNLAYDCIQNWWGTSEKQKKLLHNKMQVRHLILIGCFGLVTDFGVIGQVYDAAVFSLVAYLLGIVTLVGAVMSISIMRSQREGELADIESRWGRTIHGLPEPKDDP